MATKPVLENKVFRDVAELDAAIAEFERLDEIVRATNPTAFRHDAPEVGECNRKVERSVSRVFGANTVEFKQAGQFSVAGGGMHMLRSEFGQLHRASDHEYQLEFETTHPKSVQRIHGILEDLRFQRLHFRGALAANPPAPPASRLLGHAVTHVHVGANHGQIVTNSPGSTLNLTVNSSAEARAALADLVDKFKAAQLPPADQADAIELIELLDEKAQLSPSKRARDAITIQSALVSLAAMVTVLAGAAAAAQVIVDAIRHWFGV